MRTTKKRQLLLAIGAATVGVALLALVVTIGNRSDQASKTTRFLPEGPDARFDTLPPRAIVGATAGELRLDTDPPTDVPLGVDNSLVEANLAVPVHLWQLDRVRNIRGETIEEVVQNLGHYDDCHLATTSTPDGFLGDGMSDGTIVTRLFRVRRLLEVGRNDPDSVVPPLRRAFESSLKDWPKLLAETGRLMNEGINSGKLFDDVLAAEVTALAATYLLAEFDDHASLPIMKKNVEFVFADSPTPAGGHFYGPASPGFTLYCMCRLVSSFPIERLNPEARRLRKEFMRSAKGALAESQEITVERWDAKYDESDVRFQINPRARTILLASTSKMKMLVYPGTFSDGTPLSTPAHHLHLKALELYGQIMAFMDSAGLCPAH